MVMNACLRRKGIKVERKEKREKSALPVGLEPTTSCFGSSCGQVHYHCAMRELLQKKYTYAHKRVMLPATLLDIKSVLQKNRVSGSKLSNLQLILFYSELCALN